MPEARNQTGSLHDIRNANQTSTPHTAKPVQDTTIAIRTRGFHGAQTRATRSAKQDDSRQRSGSYARRTRSSTAASASSGRATLRESSTRGVKKDQNYKALARTGTFGGKIMSTRPVSSAQRPPTKPKTTHVLRVPTARTTRARSASSEPPELVSKSKSKRTASTVLPKGTSKKTRRSSATVESAVGEPDGAQSRANRRSKATSGAAGENRSTRSSMDSMHMRAYARLWSFGHASCVQGTKSHASTIACLHPDVSTCLHTLRLGAASASTRGGREISSAVSSPRRASVGVSSPRTASGGLSSPRSASGGVSSPRRTPTSSSRVRTR